jgi:hypothetical protein
MNTLAMLVAEAAPAAAGDKVAGWLTFLLDNPFALALTLVFLVAVIGAFIAARKRDRCLKKFRKSPVTIEEQGGRRLWGFLRVFSKGMELVYETPFDRPAKRSFLIYEGEYGRLLAIYRFLGRMSEKDRRRRRRRAHPPFYSRLGRWIRNILNTFRDAIVGAMGMTVQQAARAAPNPVLQAQGGQINAIGALLVGETANAYEPMIEQYINAPVILELVNPADPQKRIVEYHGSLGEYSAQFILLYDVRRTFQERTPLDGQEHRFLEDKVVVRYDQGRLLVENGSAVAIKVEAVEVGGNRQAVETAVPPGESAEVALPAEAPAAGTQHGNLPCWVPAAAVLAWERTFDLIVPRSCGIVRHAGTRG